MSYSRRLVTKFSDVNSVKGEFLYDAKAGFNHFTVTPYRL